MVSIVNELVDKENDELFIDDCDIVHNEQLFVGKNDAEGDETKIFVEECINDGSLEDEFLILEATNILE